MPCGTRVSLQDFVVFAYGAVTLFGRPFQKTFRLTAKLLVIALGYYLSDPTTPMQQRPKAYTALVWAGPRSLATTEGVSVDFFSSGYLDVSVRRVCHPSPMDSVMGPWVYPSRFPDSETSGSQPVSGSPKLFAAVHVLHRLLMPRHPPYALASLTVSLRHVSSAQSQSSTQQHCCSAMSRSQRDGFIRLHTRSCARTIASSLFVFSKTGIRRGLVGWS